MSRCPISEKESGELKGYGAPRSSDDAGERGVFAFIFFDLHFLASRNQSPPRVTLFLNKLSGCTAQTFARSGNLGHGRCTPRLVCWML